MTCDGCQHTHHILCKGINSVKECPRHLVPTLSHVGQEFWNKLYIPALNIGLLQVAVGFGTAIVNFNPEAIKFIFDSYMLDPYLREYFLDLFQICIVIHSEVQRDELHKQSQQQQSIYR